ncbi:MAG: 50S ribosomal protein L23 [Alphaproteobacteria bacterium]
MSEKALTILIKPLVTEKTTRMAEAGNWLSFVVSNDATKPDIRNAVEVLYGVEVEAVNTQVQKGKTKAPKGRRVFRSDVKKAFIKLKAGQSVDLMAGVK